MLIQLERSEEEANLKEIMMQNDIEELTSQLSRETKALQAAEGMLRDRNRELQAALGDANEKEDELDMLTAQVRSTSTPIDPPFIHPLPFSTPV